MAKGMTLVGLDAHARQTHAAVLDAVTGKLDVRKAARAAARAGVDPWKGSGGRRWLTPLQLPGRRWSSPGQLFSRVGLARAMSPQTPGDKDL